MKEPGNNSETGRVTGVMQALAWISLLVLAVLFFQDLLGRQYNPNQAPEVGVGEDGAQEVILQRNRQGHYVADGAINGQPVTFMLDTGATMVALPAHLATKLGIKRGRALQFQTANGIARGFAARLDDVALGPITLQDVEAGITQGLTGDEVLLGMSFLKHIEFTQRGDTLTLRQ